MSQSSVLRTWWLENLILIILSGEGRFCCNYFWMDAAFDVAFALKNQHFLCHFVTNYGENITAGFFFCHLRCTKASKCLASNYTEKFSLVCNILVWFACWGFQNICLNILGFDEMAVAMFFFANNGSFSVFLAHNGWFSIFLETTGDFQFFFASNGWFSLFVFFWNLGQFSLRDLKMHPYWLITLIITRTSLCCNHN